MKYAILTAACLGFGFTAHGQSDSQPNPQAPAEGTSERESMRQRIERRLEETRKHLQSLEESLKTLNAGGDLAPLKMLMDRRGGWRGGSGRGDDNQSRDSGPITPEERETLLALMKEVMPVLAARLETLQNNDPEAAERMSGRLLMRLREAAELKDREPELYAFKIEELKAWADVMSAAQALRERAPESDATALREKLREAVARQFDARQATQNQEIAELEKKLASLREETARKESNRSQAIDEFMAKLEATRPDGSRRRNEQDRKQ